MHVDVHAHYFPPEYVDPLTRYGGRVAAMSQHVPGARLPLDERLGLLDEVGIDMQVLSVASAQPYLPEAAQAVELARLANDIYADVVRRYPGRFAAFGCAPLPHVDAALAEAERCLDTLGCVGMTTGCSVAGRPLDDPAFEPFWAELDRRGSALFLHPMGAGFGGELTPYGLDWLVGALFEDTVAALRLVISGVTTRYPNMRVIIPHLGGTLPFAMGRFGRATVAERTRVGQESGEFAGTLRENFRRVWYDTVNHEPSALQCACEVFGTDRLLLGTDYPYPVGDRLKHCLDYVEEADLGAADKEAILGGNAQALLGLPAR
jgi:predicted TIM-barrel fold metal-dependent hydrolase